MGHNADRFDLVVIGGGSGGIGAALAAARLGLSVALVERWPMLGGTSTMAGVCCWEPSVGGTGIPFDLYRRLRAIPNSVGVYVQKRHFLWANAHEWPDYPERLDVPGAENVLDPSLSYSDSLLRHRPGGLPVDEAFIRSSQHGVVFEPEVLARTARELLEEAGCTVMMNTAFTHACVEDGSLVRVRLENGKVLQATVFVDATGDGSLSSVSGAELLVGHDPRSRFDEPSAPEEADEGALNGATLMFSVRPAEHACTDVPDPPECWWDSRYPLVVYNHLPAGGVQVNMLPTMSGDQAVALGAEAAYDECKRRTRAQWAYLQRFWPEFRGYEYAGPARMLGLRETYRVVCDYMLTEHDVGDGLSKQSHPDIVTITDHPFDAHSRRRRRSGELAEPYGVPYRSLIVRGLENLLVASRCAGFSSIAASSCRLSRTMIQLGQAAGTAAAIAVRSGCPLREVAPERLRAELRNQHVQLEWPISPELLGHLETAT